MYSHSPGHTFPTLHTAGTPTSPAPEAPLWPIWNQNELCDWVFTIVVTIQISTSCFLFTNQLKAQRCTWQLRLPKAPPTHPCLPGHPTAVGLSGAGSHPCKCQQDREKESERMDKLSAQISFRSQQHTPFLRHQICSKPFAGLRGFLAKDSNPVPGNRSPGQLSKWLEGFELWPHTLHSHPIHLHPTWVLVPYLTSMPSNPLG